MKNSLLFIALLIVTETVWGADLLYVQSSTAKLLGRPSFNATLIVKLDKGAALQVIESSGSWIKVQHKEKIGWLPRLLLSKNPPMDLPPALQGNTDKRRADNSTTTPTPNNDNHSSASDGADTNHATMEKFDSVKVNQSNAETN